jgi:tRNA A-37 threonylcarbamoyl transferase component Bud32
MDASLVSNGKRLNFFVDSNLYSRINREAEDRKIKISEFLRRALEYYLERSEAERMKKILEEGYKANYETDLELNREWESVDAY